jgi:hypothetical protein
MEEYITKSTILNSPWNKNLTKNNFMISTESPSRLRDLDGLWLVLFYGEDNNSIEFLKKWSKISHDIVGPDFGSCNLRVEHELSSAIFNDQGSMVITKKRLPYVVCYKNSWPTSPIFDDKLEKLESWITSILMIDITTSTNIGTGTTVQEKPIELPKTL